MLEYLIQILWFVIVISEFIKKTGIRPVIDRDILRFAAETVIDYYILQFIKNQGCMLKNILKPFRCIILHIKNC